MKKLLTFLLVFSITLPCFAAKSVDMSEYLSKAQADGIIFGDEKGVLNEDKKATRAEFLAIATRFWGLSGGENIFSDVTEDDWFCKSIAAANFCGIFSGTPEGEARPYELIKTEDAVSIIGRYYNATAHKGKYTGLAEYAEHYFGYAFENGLFSSWRHLPNPKQSVTKGEIIALFYGYRDKNEQTDCFQDGYPKISKNQQFNSLSVDVSTKTDCKISYAITEKDGKGYSWTDIAEIQKAGEIKTISITADINKIYNLYVKAVSKENGGSQIIELLNVAPLSFTRGDGSESQPYVIYSEIQLRQISAFADKSFILGNNITVSGEWTPIKNFKGVLDGDGYRIDGIAITDNGQRAGLFESVRGGTVKNLAVFADISVKDTAGIIAGENNGGHILGCTATGTVYVSGANGGGICGINKGEIADCLSAVYSVTAGSFAGGIAGQNMGDIKNCLSAAETVTSDMYAGGVAGTNNGGYISGCVAANIAVYNTMTYNGGKISTNRNEGVMRNNYSFSDMVSNAAKTEMNANSRNGLEVTWDTLSDENFYFGIGWNVKNWKEAKKGFKFVCPKNTAEPVLESGRTPYLPKKIASAEELIGINKNGKGHYVLVRDITLNAPWKTIDFKDGFSGTLDGDGHTIYNLSLKGETGMFSNITGGTVKNLRLKQVNATFNTSGGVISACNYGYIENCTVSGEIATTRADRIGGITAENNGRVENCKVKADITANVDEITVGGICAENLGVVSKSAFSGTITVSAVNSAVGGICGADAEGYISESSANAKIITEQGNAVTGGICAVSEFTQVYKCASMGELKQKGADVASGGICGTADGATVYNCFSNTNISVEAENAESGGICAVAVGSNIQNTYATGEIKNVGKNGIVGGICGEAQDSFISQNVALNPLISAEKLGAIVGEYENSDVADNYSCKNMRKNSKTAQSLDKNGTVTSEKELLTAEFYLKPLSENGALGWDETAWTQQEGYFLPVLTDTPLMMNVKNPEYK